MKALWSYETHYVNGQVFVADVVRVRTTPYTQVRVDSYLFESATKISTNTYRSLATALDHMRAEAKCHGQVGREAVADLRAYEPEGCNLLFSHTRDHVARWFAAAGSQARAGVPEAPWSDIGEWLEATHVTPNQSRTGEPWVEAHQLLVHTVEKLTDLLIWELRLSRALLLDPTLTPRRSYIRATQCVVANLEVLKHLAPFYVTPSPSTALSRAPAKVVDLSEWKRNRSRTG